VFPLLLIQTENEIGFFYLNQVWRGGHGSNPNSWLLGRYLQLSEDSFPILTSYISAVHNSAIILSDRKDELIWSMSPSSS
jgi:hypothetical protein